MTVIKKPQGPKSSVPKIPKTNATIAAVMYLLKLKAPYSCFHLLLKRHRLLFLLQISSHFLE